MKIKASVFIAACMILLMIPSAGMLVHPTTKTTENKKMAEFPAVIADGSVNTDFFNQFEIYFNQHMAFRNRFLSLDARIMDQIFQESNVSGVITGTEDWLFYSSTLDDYQGNNQFSDRQLRALAWNLSIVADYLDQKGIDYQIMIPPNKNSLYGQYMPYYTGPSVRLEEHNALRLSPLLEVMEINYCDLFTLLGKQKGILYEKKDSHWNEIGAMLVYDHSLELLEKEHETYPIAGMNSHRNGDLNKMLYSFYGDKEMVPFFQLPQEYEIVTPGATVESGWIATEAENGEGKLLMFRDSFANTLIPLYSNVYAEAYYSKGQPHVMESYLEKYKPDTVIIEKVERNLKDYLTAPPIISAPETQLPSKVTMLIRKELPPVEIKNLEESPGYVSISGAVPGKGLQDPTEYVIAVNGKAMKAYQRFDGSFLLYQKAEDVPEDSQIQIYVHTAEGWFLLAERT